MIFGQDRGELRRMYAEAWRKFEAGEAMSALEAQIAQVIGEHPEYRDAVTGDPDREFPVEGGRTNPFLHLALHLGIREQVATDRPPGVAGIFAGLAKRIGDPHTAEHGMIDCLAETLWEAQSAGRPPDEAAYLERLRKL